MKAESLCLLLLRAARFYIVGLINCFTLQTAMSSELSVIVEVEATLGGVFSVPSQVPWVKTSCTLKKGDWYRVTAAESRFYKDSFIACTAEGPRGALGRMFDRLARSPGRLNPLRFFGPGITKRLRVLRDQTEERRRASFLTLIATIDKDDTEASAIVIGADRTFQAQRDGVLYLFCNDWPGGVGLDGERRFRNPAKSGKKALPTYGNNQGHLNVTVTEIPQPH